MQACFPGGDRSAFISRKAGASLPPPLGPILGPILGVLLGGPLLAISFLDGLRRQWAEELASLIPCLSNRAGRTSTCPTPLILKPEAASASEPAACTRASGPAREPSTGCGNGPKVRSGYRREMKRSPSPLKSAGTGQTCDPR